MINQFFGFCSNKQTNRQTSAMFSHPMFPINILNGSLRKRRFKRKSRRGWSIVTCPEYEGKICSNELCPFHEFTGFTLTLLEKGPTEKNWEFRESVWRSDTSSGSKFDPATSVKVGLGISQTDADSRWNPAYKTLHQTHRCRNETICRL